MRRWQQMTSTACPSTNVRLDKVKGTASKILAALTLSVTVVLIALSLISIREANVLKRGIAEGFHLDGVYRDQKTELTSLAFHAEDGHRWQIIDGNGRQDNGSFNATSDPNIFTLIDQSGNDYGFVHLSCSSPDGNSGTLYLSAGASMVAFDKVSNKPAFVES